VAEPPQVEVTAPGMMPSQESLEDERVSPTPEDAIGGTYSSLCKTFINTWLPDPDSADDLAEQSEEQGTRDYDGMVDVIFFEWLCVLADDGVGRLSLLSTTLTILFSLVVLL